LEGVGTDAEVGLDAAVDFRGGREDGAEVETGGEGEFIEAGGVEEAVGGDVDDAVFFLEGEEVLAEEDASGEFCEEFFGGIVNGEVCEGHFKVGGEGAEDFFFRGGVTEGVFEKDSACDFFAHFGNGGVVEDSVLEEDFEDVVHK
jgi:hypothetical protein